MTTEPNLSPRPRRSLRKVLWPNLDEFDSDMSKQERIGLPVTILGLGMRGVLQLGVGILIATLVVVFGGDSPLRYVFAAFMAFVILPAVLSLVLTARVVFHFYLRPGRGERR